MSRENLGVSVVVVSSPDEKVPFVGLVIKFKARNNPAELLSGLKRAKEATFSLPRRANVGGVPVSYYLMERSSMRCFQSWASHEVSQPRDDRARFHGEPENPNVHCSVEARRIMGRYNIAPVFFPSNTHSRTSSRCSRHSNIVWKFNSTPSSTSSSSMTCMLIKTS